ncbi:copper resistance CopC family protein [Cellulomonas sp. PhB150]|uniref:copper resistance CopC family protein n=1 Tax=Cellulomonas sp. PhB150 TaxID=2485188 RepID=UPI0011CDB93B|nr:copper resistance CopC family protein [Cellulomonas sp. PhB150]
MRRRTAPAAGLLVGLLLALGVVAAPAAQAHDELVSVDPADGSTVTAVPDHVTLTFEDPAVALGTVIEVKGPDGSVVSTGDAELVDNTVSQAIGGDLPAGAYTVAWRVTSQDGHAVSGTFGFTAEAGALPVPSETPTTGSGVSESASPSATASDAPVAAPSSSASSSASASASSSDSSEGDSGGGSPALLVVGAGLLVGIMFGLLGWMRARRRRASTPGGAQRP